MYSDVPHLSGLIYSRAGPNYLGIRITKLKFCPTEHTKKKSLLSAKVKLRKAEILYLRV
jgi:hypothetical protein